MMATWSGRLSNLFTFSTLTPSNSVSSVTNAAGGKRAMMTFGPCQFESRTGQFKCPCKAGSGISSTSAVDLQMLCSECGHPLAQHMHYGEESPDHLLPPSASPQSSGKPHFKVEDDVCPRSETVETLVQMLNEYAVVHVRGTPATGKTTLALLLQKHLEGSHRVIFIDHWEANFRSTGYLVEQSHQSGHKEVQANDFFGSQNDNVVFIIDEAQVTYADSHLWYTVIKTRIGRSYGPRFCLFSSYGSPSTGAPEFNYPVATTPPILRREQRVSLTIPTGLEGSKISLFYTPAEFEDVIVRFCRRSTVEFTLAQDLQSYTFSLTNGHPGMVHAILTFIELTYRHRFKRTEIRKITLGHIRDDLENDSKLFEYLKFFPAGRGLPSPEMLRLDATPDIIAVFLHILRDGSVKLDPLNKAMVRAFQLGFLHTELLAGEPQLTCVLPSPLHARFIEYCYGRSDPKPFPFKDYPEIRELCLVVVRHFSRKMLCMTSNSQRLGPAGRVRPPEACFQDEFYRCFWNVLGPGIGISSEWSGTGRGRIDFHIPEPGWGFELLRDGDRLKQHCDRFCPNGAYYPWIQQGKLRDWLILDCRHSCPRTTCPGQPKLWRVVFADDYSRIRILNCENEEVVPEFQLANS